MPWFSSCSAAVAAAADTCIGSIGGRTFAASSPTAHRARGRGAHPQWSGSSSSAACCPPCARRRRAFVEDLVTAGLMVAWGLVWLRVAGVDLGSLITTSAVITGVVAFSMQETLGNILGGIVLQLDQSIRVGDWMKVEETSGRVVEIRWRYTAVETRNARRS